MQGTRIALQFLSKMMQVMMARYKLERESIEIKSLLSIKEDVAIYKQTF